MNLTDYYRILGLRIGADFRSVKSAYRELARRYHPDINPHDLQSKEKFIRITQAYQAITSEFLSQNTLSETDINSSHISHSEIDEIIETQTNIRTPPQIQLDADLSATEKKLKQLGFDKLQALFRLQRFPRAIALVEGLSQRMPEDKEIRQWRAITYQRWGRYLINNGEPRKGQLYLQKALKTDPMNKSLQQEIGKDFQRLQVLSSKAFAKKAP